MKLTLVGGALALVAIAHPGLAQQQGFLGIRPRVVDAPDHCMEIDLLAPGGPGERAGLEPGDVILSIQGVAFECDKLVRGKPLVPQVKGGDRIAFRVQRGGKVLDIVVQADSLPAEVVKAQQDFAKNQAGRAIFERLVKAKEVFTITLLPAGGFGVSGNLNEEEIELLHFYLEKVGDGAMFPKFMTKPSQDMYVHFDRAKGAYQYELVDSPQSEKQPRQ